MDGEAEERTLERPSESIFSTTIGSRLAKTWELKESISTAEPGTPEVARFIKQNYAETKFLYPKHSFFEMVKRKFPPLRTERWCCDYLRKLPSRHIPLKHRIMGMRAEESRKRSERPRIDLNKREHPHIYKPIFDWQEWAVWEFIESRNLSYPNLYDEGWSRVGCVICPFICSPNMKMVNRNKAKWPGMYKAFEHAVRKWFQRLLPQLPVIVAVLVTVSKTPPLLFPGHNVEFTPLLCYIVAHMEEIL